MRNVYWEWREKSIEMRCIEWRCLTSFDDSLFHSICWISFECQFGSLQKLWRSKLFASEGKVRLWKTQMTNMHDIMILDTVFSLFIWSYLYKLSLLLRFVFQTVLLCSEHFPLETSAAAPMLPRIACFLAAASAVDAFEATSANWEEHIDAQLISQGTISLARK